MPINSLQEKAEKYELEHAPRDLETSSSDAGHVLSAAAERKLVRKIDLAIGPLFFLIYLITFIDRANYFISLTVFYIFYALWEMPSNIVCRAIGARYWVSLQVFAFGLVCMATGYVKNYGGFIAVRVALGLAEGGVLPALALVLSRFYRRDELVFRIGILVSAASLAGGFGGLLASAFISIGPVKGIGAAWCNIFFGEGLITIAISFFCFFCVPTGPSDAYFLTTEERLLAVERLGSRTGAPVAEISPAQKRALTIKAFTSIPTWLCAWGYLATNVSVQGVSLFLPTIIRALYPGMSTVQIQLRTVPPYIVAFVWTLSLTYLSNRIDRRGFVLLCTSPFAVAGYITFVATGLSDVDARYGGCFLCILGAFPVGPFVMAWATNNAATDVERGIASGLVPGFGQFGAIVATWSYLPKDAPNYRTGHSINIGFTLLCWSLTAANLAYVTWENKARAGGKRDYRLAKVKNDEDAANTLGSLHPSFKYST